MVGNRHSRAGSGGAGKSGGDRRSHPGTSRDLRSGNTVDAEDGQGCHCRCGAGEGPNRRDQEAGKEYDYLLRFEQRCRCAANVNQAKGTLMIRVIAAAIFCIQLFGMAGSLFAAESLDQLVAAGKKEGEVTLLASASTFGGKKGFADLESAFNKKFGLQIK